MAAVDSVGSWVFAEDMIISFHKSAASSGGRALHGRDVFNEKPNTEDALVEGGAEGEERAVLPRGAVLHTSRGDITLRLFPDEARLDQGLLLWDGQRSGGGDVKAMRVGRCGSPAAATSRCACSPAKAPGLGSSFKVDKGVSDGGKACVLVHQQRRHRPAPVPGRGMPGSG